MAIPFVIAAGGLVVAVAYAAQYDVGGLLREEFFRLGGCDNNAPDAPECAGAFEGVRLLSIQSEAIAKVGLAVGVVAGIVGRGSWGWSGMLAGALLVGLSVDVLRLLPEIRQNGWLLFLLVMTPGYAGAQVVVRVAARARRRCSAETDATRAIRGGSRPGVSEQSLDMPRG